MTRRQRPPLAGPIGAVLIVFGVLAALVPSPRVAWAATTPTGTLYGEGGSFAEPIANQLINDDTAGLAPLNGTYFQANVDNARQDLVNGAADFALSEFPLTSAEVATGKKNGRTFAYVPLAGSAVAMAAVVECENDNVLKSTTMCPDLQLDSYELAKIFTFGVSQWNSPQLTGVQGGGSISPTNQSNSIVANNVVDPSAANFALQTLIVNDSSAKQVWDAWLGTHHITNDTPQELWPTDVGVSGGDSALADTLVPLNVTTLQPEPNPSTWGQGEIAPLPIDWTGAPRHIPTVALKNAAGDFVGPTPAATTAALNDATFDPQTNLVTFNQKATDAAEYPMAQMSYLIVPITGLSAPKAKALSNFVTFALGTKGQADIESLGAVPPTAAMTRAGLAVAAKLAAEAKTAPTTTSTTHKTPASTTSTTTHPATTTTTLSSTGGTTPTTSSPVLTSAGSGSGSSGGTGSSSLAFTGAVVWPFLVGGGILLVMGGAVRRRARRQVTP